MADEPGALGSELRQVLEGQRSTEPLYPAAAVARETVSVLMRDGTRLATDLWLPPGRRGPAVVLRTPYGRAEFADFMAEFARRGYVGVAQDCRGTGDSEPDYWDFSIYEDDDSIDCVEWISHQDWFDGFIGSIGGSYRAGTQWCMALHPAMSAIAPEMGGLGIEPITGPRLYMFVNSYSVSVGRGAEKADAGYEQTDVEMAAETLAGGYFNEPLHGAFSPRLLERHPELSGLPLEQQQRQLWERFRRLPATADRAALLKLASGADTITFQTQETLQDVFGHLASRRALCLPGLDDAELAAAVRAPVLMISGWYDWSLGDQLATWELLGRAGTERVASRSRLLVTPSAHNMTGYHEGREGHQELDRTYRTAEIGELLARWYTAVREDSLDSWPPVIYYLMGANQWRTAASWPPPEATAVRFYLHAGGTLSTAPAGPSDPDRYRYDPDDPAPTVGGSIVSYVYPPGSVDVSAAQQRPDVLTYTTGPLEHDLDVAGPLTMTLYASSSAVDTDFVARLTDVFPDGRAIQLQAGALRTRYRDPGQEPALLEPGRVYRLDIDMWATACRFRAGHRLRVDIASADFPKFDRNTNRGGDPGPPLTAEQAIYHDPGHPSHLQVLTLPPEPGQD